MSTASPYADSPQQPQPQPQQSNVGKILLIVFGVLFLLALLCAGVLAALLIPAVSAARTAAQRMEKQNAMKQIGLAMHNYHSAMQGLPPAYTVDADGQPLFSWRVALLPYMEHRDIWDQWDSNAAYNVPPNNALMGTTPAAFQLGKPDGSVETPGRTGVVAIRAENGLFPSDESVRFRDCVDGLSNTVAFVYLPAYEVPWGAPEDITPDACYSRLQNVTGEDPALFVFGDGAVRAVTSPPSRETFDALISRDGGEMITGAF